MERDAIIAALRAEIGRQFEEDRLGWWRDNAAEQGHVEPPDTTVDVDGTLDLAGLADAVLRLAQPHS